MKFKSDIDIDFGDRDKILGLIQYTAAAMRGVSPIRKHNTGIYVTDIPYDPVNDMSALDYTEAEDRGYIKLDFLNVHIYNKVKSEQHLVELMSEPNWDNLRDPSFVEKVIHIGKHYDLLKSMPEPVNSVPRLAMFLALIRPGKKHLRGKTWQEVSETIWLQDSDGYVFKKSHSLAYAHLVVVNMNLLEQDPMAFSLPE